jgi:hypothetical protein
MRWWWRKKSAKAAKKALPATAPMYAESVQIFYEESKAARAAMDELQTSSAVPEPQIIQVEQVIGNGGQTTLGREVP